MANFISTQNELAIIDSELCRLKFELNALSITYDDVLHNWPVQPPANEQKETVEVRGQDDPVNRELLEVEKALTKARLVHRRTLDAAQPKKSFLKKKDATVPKIRPEKQEQKTKETKNLKHRSTYLPHKQCLKEIIHDIQPLPDITKLLSMHRKICAEFPVEKATKTSPDKIKFLATVQGNNKSFMYEHVFKARVTNCLVTCEKCISALAYKETLTKSTKGNFLYFEKQLLSLVKGIYNDLLEEISALISCDVIEIPAIKFDQLGHRDPMVVYSDLETSILAKSCPVQTTFYQDKADLLKWSETIHRFQNLKNDLKMKTKIDEAFKTEYSSTSTTDDRGTVELLENIYSLLCADGNLPAAVAFES